MSGKNKRYIAAIVALIAVLALAVCAMASDVVYKKDKVKDTGETLVTITQPAREYTSNSRTILLVGNTDYANVRVELYIASGDVYKPKAATDGSSSWVIGSSGFFSKEVELNKGVNELMVRASKEGKPDQFSLFTVHVSEESLKDIIRNGINNLLSKITDFFK